MSILAVIPARYNSKRFKGKIIADLGGKPLIQHVYENVRKSKLIDKIIIATDDEKVFKTVRNFKADVVMTSKTLSSGTERVLAVAKQDKSSSIVVNIQGDEPLVNMKDVDKAIETLKKHQDIGVSTLYYPLRDKAEINNPNVVKVIKDKNDFAIYFSRFPIPYIRDKSCIKRYAAYYKHLGVYCYRKGFLLNFKRLASSSLEKAEKLEQLKILENGYKIKLVKAGQDSIGVDTKEDLKRVKKHITRRQVSNR